MLKGDKYIAIFKLSVIQALKNYKALIGLSIFIIACLLVFDHIWKAASLTSPTPFFTPQQLLWFIAFNEWILIATPEIQFDMQEDLRSGRLAYLLPRPISYIGSIFTTGAGTLLVNLVVLGTVAFIFSYLSVGWLDISPSMFILVLFLGLLAGIVALIFQMVIGMFAFWLDEVGPLNWIWQKFLFVFGGLILPLSAYPLWMQNIAAFTPFPGILGGRSMIAINGTWSDMFWMALLLILWGFIGFGVLYLLYKKGLKILNIEGG